jgi:hypothetical protein
LSCLIKEIKKVKLKGRNRFISNEKPNGRHFLVAVKLPEEVSYGRDQFCGFYEIGSIMPNK